MLKPFEHRMTTAVQGLEGCYAVDGDGTMQLDGPAHEVAQSIAMASMLLSELIAHDKQVRSGNGLGGRRSRRS